MNSSRVALLLAMALLLALAAAALFIGKRHPTDYFPSPENSPRGA